MSIRLIASDLDGTLLTDCKELSPKTREVLDLAVQHGIYIVPATGRSFHSIPEMIRNYPGVEYVITANGGAVYSVREGKRVYQCLLEKESHEFISQLIYAPFSNWSIKRPFPSASSASIKALSAWRLAS